MNKKIIKVNWIVLLAIIFNIINPSITTVFAEEKAVELKEQWNYRCDINYDFSIDDKDLDELIIRYNLTPNSINWDKKCDINSDNIIDIFDIVIVSKNIGKTINPYEVISPIEIADKVIDNNAKIEFLYTVNSDPELLEYYNSNKFKQQVVSSNFTITLKDEFEANNLINNRGFVSILAELNSQLRAIGMPVELRYAFVAGGAGIIPAIADGPLPIGDIMSIIIGVGVFAIILYNWDYIEEHSTEIIMVLKNVFYQVSNMIDGYFNDFIHYVESKQHTNSAGEPVERGFVDNQDDLLGEAEREAGGNLDDLTETKDSHWVSKDKLTQVEWEPSGHANTNEGPHVTVYKRGTPQGKWKVVKKIFIKGWETYKRPFYPQ